MKNDERSSDEYLVFLIFDELYLLNQNKSDNKYCGTSNDI